MVVYSFLRAGNYGGVEWQFSTEGWFNVFFRRDIFDESVHVADAHLSILWRSVKLAAVTTVGTLVLGFPTAYFIATRHERSRNVWLFLITVPFWTNLLIRTFAMIELIRNEGVINVFLVRAGLLDSPIQLLHTETGVLIGMLYVFLPLMVLPLYASLERFDFRLVEAAHDLYANRLRTVLHVILPLVRPGIVAGSILVFIPALGTYVIPRLMGGGKKWMISNLIENQFGQGQNWPLGAALSITLMMIVTAVLLWYVRFTRTRANP